MNDFVLYLLSEKSRKLEYQIVFPVQSELLSCFIPVILTGFSSQGTDKVT